MMTHSNKSINNKDRNNSSINATAASKRCGVMSDGFTPESADVICGRGCAYSSHPGNKIFSDIVQAHLQKYINAPTRIGKSMVVAHVLERVLESGSRFVKKEKGTRKWTQMTREEAHNKTGHAIRDMIRNTGGKDSTNISASDTISLRRSLSAEAKKSCQAIESANHKRSRSLADVVVAFAPRILFSDKKDNNERMSFETSSNTIDDVLRTVCDLHVNSDLIKTFDDTPLPRSEFNENLYHAVPLPVANPFDDSTIDDCDAHMIEDEDMFPNMYDSLFS